MNTLSGQSLGDRVNAARYAISGQGLARVVCKATTEELIAPKKKHIDYLLQCTNEPNVSIPQLATLLIDRTSHSNWVVVFKGLVTIHHLMCFGNERFTQYLASSNCNFQLSNYLDKSGPKCYDMSIFIRRYAKYLNAKALSYRTVAFDFTKLKRNDSETTLRSMGTEKLVKIVPVVQQQIDTLIEFDCTASDLTNGVINAAFFLLFKDLVRMFACYNEGVISLLEKYFEQQNKKLVRDTLDIYKKFLARMDGVGNFLKIAEQIGIERGEIPDLSRAPASLLEAMEQHCAHVEGKKISTGSTSNGAENGQTSAIKAIEEEEKFLNQLKEKHIQEKKANNPFLSLGSGPNAPSSTAASTAATAAATTSSTSSKPSSNMFDMFGADVGNNSATSKATSDDLFTLSNDQSGGDGGGGQLGANNPFADILSAMSTTTTATTGNANATTGNNFATSDGFAAAFGSASNSNIGFDAFGDVLQPQNVSTLAHSRSMLSSGSTGVGLTPLTNTNNGNQSQLQQNYQLKTTVPTNNNLSISPHSNTTPVPSSSSSQSLLKGGDLEASLANLAQNLDINGPKGSGGFKKTGQFNQSPKSMMKTGGGVSGGNGFNNDHQTVNSMANSISVPSISSSMWNMPMSGGGGGVGIGIGGGGGGGIGVSVSPMSGMAPLGWQQPTAWTNTATNMGQPIMPIRMGGMSMQPNVQQQQQQQQTMPIPYGMRPPNMIPGAVPVLPSGVTSAKLANALANQTSPTSNMNFNNSNTTSMNQAVSDPFGAL